MIDNNKENKGLVLEIQRMSTEDGPGIRTTVFFKGCPLSCQWCHNPESISSKPEVQWIASRCIGCDICISECPERAIAKNESGITIDRNKCTGCGTCTKECPSTAMELLGTEWDVMDLFNEIIKDRSYFEKSGGGITVSGGEPTVQSPFVLSLLQLLKEEGIHTALDTCGLCSRDSLERLLPFADMVLFDLKEIDAEKHVKFTGSSNKRILDNLMYLKDYIASHIVPKHLWVRTPVIPGKTDSIENIFGIGRFIAEFTGTIVDRWELCSFNNLCKDKYYRLNQGWSLQNAQLITEDRMNELAMAAKESGVDPEIVHWSGATRLNSSDKEKTEKRNDIKKSIRTNSC